MYFRYIFIALQIFTLSYISARIIDDFFKKISKNKTKVERKMLALAQLLTVISIAYIWHITTSDQFSNNFQIAHPSILMSSLILNLQDTMFQNLS